VRFERPPRRNRFARCRTTERHRCPSQIGCWLDEVRAIFPRHSLILPPAMVICPARDVNSGAARAGDIEGGAAAFDSVALPS